MAGRRAASGRGSGNGRGDNSGRGTGGRGSGSGGGPGSGSGGGLGDTDGNGGQGDTNENGDQRVNDGEGSGTGAREGGSTEGAREGGSEAVRGGARRGRQRRPVDDMNSECLLWDDDERQILAMGEDSDPRKHKTRGYSPGGFGKYPNQHERKVVRIAGNLIDCPQALRTLLAIMRMFWPDGCVGALEIDRKSSEFWNKCINEFLRYYTYDPRVATEDEARASIRAHMRDNLRRTLSDDRERADIKIVDAKGTTYADHRPLYMKPGVWSRLAEYWVSDEFKKKSIAGKKAREAVKAPHTSGARSFDRRRRDYIEAHNGKLDELAVYKDCHTLKDEERKGEWITKEAKLIIERYISICEKKGLDPTKTHIQAWIEAVGGVRKNKIVGHPQLRVSDVYVTESDGHPPRPRKGEGSSGRSALARLQDDMFMRVVDETLAMARANPEEFMLTPEQIRLLARDVVEGDSSLPADHPIARETRHAIIQVAVDVLNNIYKRDGPGAAKGKAPAAEDDDPDDANDDQSTESDNDHDMSAPYEVVSRGGPVIKGIFVKEKPCPACKRPVEWNQGSIAIRCPAPCKYQFCWSCLRAWSFHSDKHFVFRLCNKFQPSKQISECRKRALENLQQMRAVHREKSIIDAWLQIVECRQVLKWTYVYGYYFAEQVSANMQQIFEDVRGRAEYNLEELHQYAELELKKYLEGHGPSMGLNMLRDKLIRLTGLTGMLFKNLIYAIEHDEADDISCMASSNATS